jgi:hypothetical protein
LISQSGETRAIFDVIIEVILSINQIVTSVFEYFYTNLGQPSIEVDKIRFVASTKSQE